MSNRFLRNLLPLILLISGTATTQTQSDTAVSTNSSVSIEEITISATKHWELAAKVIDISKSQIDDKTPTHPSELLTLVPSVTVSQGSGQEHLTAMRSAVLTGTGACGNVLFMEQGVSIRPVSFCNINNLFELDFTTADNIEVVLGPSGAVFGGNALNGAINVVREIGQENGEYSIFVQPDLFNFGYQQSFEKQEINFSVTQADSFRVDEGYTDLKYNHLFDFKGFLMSVSATALDQDTAGYIIGTDSYKDANLRKENANPEAYRKANSIRMVATGIVENWQLDSWLRFSSMEFIQHYIPRSIDPIETNGHYSAGNTIKTDIELDNGGLVIGFQSEIGVADLQQTQSHNNSCIFGTCYPQGTNYDYSVSFTNFAAFANSNFLVSQNWSLILDGRLQTDNFDYITNTRQEDACATWKAEDNSTFRGTCRYFRPMDRHDKFENFSWRVGTSKPIGANKNGLFFASFSNGFRTPQIAELYRLQYDQSVADLEGENYLQLEVGADITYFGMNIYLSSWLGKKSNVVYRNSNDLLVDNAETEHKGLEISMNLPKQNGKSFTLSFAYGDHKYSSSQGEGLSGNKIDTAPELTVNGFWQYAIGANKSLAIELEHIDEYYTNPANTAKYPGHTLLHAFYNHTLPNQWALQVQVRNATDEFYANRADNAFGNDRYFPGAPLTVGIKLSKQWQPREK